MNRRISNWKGQGMLSNDWTKTYNNYINKELCDDCQKPLATMGTDLRKGNGRCLSHNHTNGKILGVICKSCNQKDLMNGLDPTNKFRRGYHTELRFMMKEILNDIIDESLV